MYGNEVVWTGPVAAHGNNKSGYMQPNQLRIWEYAIMFLVHTMRAHTCHYPEIPFGGLGSQVVTRLKTSLSQKHSHAEQEITCATI